MLDKETNLVFVRTIKKMQLIFDKYKTALKNNLLKMRDIPNSTSNTVHWLSNIICDDAGKLSDYLKNHQIPSRRIFYPLNKQPCLKENKDVIKKRNFFGKESNFEGSERAFKTILSLPSSVYLDEEQTQYIIEKLNNYK